MNVRSFSVVVDDGFAGLQIVYISLYILLSASEENIMHQLFIVSNAHCTTHSNTIKAL